MTRFIEKPNLPEERVTSLICGGLNDELVKYFEARGIEILYTEENMTVDKAVSKHADLSVLYFGSGRIIVGKEQSKLISRLRSCGFDVTETEKRVKGRYPDDCILNHTVVGRHIIGKDKIFDRTVKCLSEGLEVVSVNQGYCKCSVLVIDDNSIITDDESIACSARKKGIECLSIAKGDVFLEGHDYGFIGGASGRISNDEIIFFGDITKHSDYSRMKRFIIDRGMKIISFDFPLTDFGGIIPIKENFF